MANIAAVVQDWGREQGIFDGYPWMTELKTSVRTFIRLPALDTGAAGMVGETRGAE